MASVLSNNDICHTVITYACIYVFFSNEMWTWQIVCRFYQESS